MTVSPLHSQHIQKKVNTAENSHKIQSDRKCDKSEQNVFLDNKNIKQTHTFAIFENNK